MATLYHHRINSIEVEFLLVMIMIQLIWTESSQNYFNLQVFLITYIQLQYFPWCHPSETFQSFLPWASSNHWGQIPNTRGHSRGSRGQNLRHRSMSRCFCPSSSFVAGQIRGGRNLGAVRGGRRHVCSKQRMMKLLISHYTICTWSNVEIRILLRWFSAIWRVFFLWEV